jgi:diketogulonate reductase-like aldo/keto reductase
MHRELNMQFVVANGARIPSLGFGTYGVRGDALSSLIPAALHAGFRHIDTAQVYANEADVGRGISQSGVPRGDIFITTKVWAPNCAPHLMGPSVDESLRKLGSDHVDLLLLHWPNSAIPLADQIGALNDIVRAGKARHIGVSNYNRALLAQAVQLSDAPLVTNQFEYHPYLEQRALVSATRQAGLAVTAYCAMAVGRVFTDPRLEEIAARTGRTVSQVVLRWLVQQGDVVALSRTSHRDRLAENTAIFDFELTAQDMAAIFALAEPGSRIVDPPGLAPKWD